jgi:hypothetical protein
LRAVAGAHAEKGKIAAAGEGLKMPAGVGHAVYFMERIGKIGDPRSGARCVNRVRKVSGIGSPRTGTVNLTLNANAAAFAHPSFSPSAWRN